MIKTVQVEEKRCICDICCDQYFVIYNPFDATRDGWIRVTNFANSGKNLDICPKCADFLKSHLDNFYTKSFSEHMNEPGSGKTDGEC